MYLALCYTLFSGYLRKMSLSEKDVDPMYLATKEAIAGGMGGFFTCAMFLNLGTYEIFYYLLILNIAQERCIRTDIDAAESRSEEKGTRH